MNKSKQIKYIELFSGIGAFTQAITQIMPNSKCVFAADFNHNCAEVFKNNYQVKSFCDITLVDEKTIPKHDFCFFSPPCQAFSKSGKQLGFNETRGTLIYDVLRIVRYHKPKYILMENVRNLVSHDNGNTYKVIVDEFKSLGYKLPEKPIILSPHYFGIPQTRERTFLPGIYDPEDKIDSLSIEFDKFLKKDECSIESVLDYNQNNDETLKISEQEINLLNIWDEFYKNIDIKVIGFPIWVDYFINLGNYDDFPNWKKSIIDKNRSLYKRNKKFIDKWIKKYQVFSKLTPTQRKFEWQAGTKIDSIWNGLIQLRPSGIRVKAPTTFPALVAMVQIPIIGKLKRRLSVKECAHLQSFGDNFVPDRIKFQAYKQFGNSINVLVLKKILNKMFH